MLRVSTLLLVLLASPLARAAPLDVEGTIDTARPLALQGDAAMSATVGVLDLTDAAVAGRAIALRAASAEGRQVTFSTLQAGPLLAQGSTEEARRLDLATGRLEDVTCQPGCFVLLEVRGRGEATVSGRAAGPLPWLQSPRAYCSWSMCGEGPNDHRVVLEPGTLRSPFASATPRVAGEAWLFLRNATATWREDGRETRLDASFEREEEAPGAWRLRERHVLLRLTDARLEGDAGPYSLLAPEATLRLDGILSTPGASGQLRVGANVTRFEAEPVEVRGEATLTLRATDGGIATLAPTSGEADVAGAMRASATLVRVGDRAWRAPLDAGPTAAAAGGLALLALLALLAPRALLPLYSRLRPDRLLARPNRARIYALLQARPGMTLAELSRETRLARVVVQHHLRMLEAHRLLVIRASGRSRLYYATADAPQPDALQRRLLLDDPTRRRVAAHVARAGAATQRDIVEATGFSQRLVSYHLRKLEDAGLVRGEGTHPRTYAPGAPLADLLPPGIGGS